MAALTIRDLPERDMSILKARANYNHRSLNGEILYLFNYISSFGETYEFPERPASLNQKDAVLELFGKWKDSRSEAETIREIESARSLGREVSL